MTADPIAHAVDRLRGIKRLADRALEQVADAAFGAEPRPGSNSVAIMVKHLAGNMRSRWTDFLATDGEKPDRHRDTEFELTEDDTRAGLMERWHAGWSLVFGALEPLGADDAARVVHIRGEPHTVLAAVNRQLAHYAYHVGQIVYVARLHAGDRWRSLSVARGASAAHNAELRESTKRDF